MSDEVLNDESENLEPATVKVNPLEKETKRLGGIAKKYRAEVETLRKQLQEKDQEVTTFKHKSEFKRFAEKMGVVDAEDAWQIGKYQAIGEPDEKSLSSFFDDLKKNKPYMFKQENETKMVNNSVNSEEQEFKRAPGGKSGGVNHQPFAAKLSWADLRNPETYDRYKNKEIAELMKLGLD